MAASKLLNTRQVFLHTLHIYKDGLWVFSLIPTFSAKKVQEAPAAKHAPRSYCSK